MAAKDADVTIKPWCPFCRQNVERPRDPDQHHMGDFPVGECQCGAVFTCDATGYNIGAAMVDALVHACKGNWDLAWDLDPETDYLTDQIDLYDEQTHQVVEKGNIDGRNVRGVLYFVRLHEDAAAISQRVADNKQQHISSRPDYLPPLEPQRDPQRQKNKATKKKVEELILAMDEDSLVDLCFDDSKTIRFMQRLLYSPDPSVMWKTVAMLGRVCARYGTRFPGKVSDLLQRLFVACSDSASSSWGNIEAIGAIIGKRPDIYGPFTRHLLNYLDDNATQEAVLWSLGSIAEHRPDLIRQQTPFYYFFNFLSYADPAIRGTTLRLLGRIKAAEATTQILPLTSDGAKFTLYEDGQPHSVNIGALAKETLEMIRAKE